MAARWSVPAHLREMPACVRVTLDEMTPREKLHLLVDELSKAEAEAALARLVREQELLAQWTGAEDAEATKDVWTLANAREAIREERW
jgi:ABC-type iron transport system FetAB ATPase subunit